MSAKAVCTSTLQFLLLVSGAAKQQPLQEPLVDPIEALRRMMQRKYSARYPEIERERIAAEITNAFLQAQHDHPAFLAHAPAMAELSRGLLPFCEAIVPRDYLEILFVAVTQSDLAPELVRESKVHYREKIFSSSTEILI